MLNIQNLEKSFGSHKVLKSINLEIKRHEIAAIIGPSGSGKSTFLRCINALEIADSGIIEIDSMRFDYSHHKRSEILSLRHKSAMVFQNYNLFANKNIIENITEALIIVQKMPKTQAKEIAMEKLVQVGLEDKARFYPYQLSGGQQQRVGIARALAIKPSILLLDEPTSALDPELVGEVLDVISRIQDTTMLLVTHELHFARALADSIIFMDNGEIVEKSEPRAFFENAKSSRARAFVEKMLEREKAVYTKRYKT